MDYLKQSIIATINLLNHEYDFYHLWNKDYSELEKIRDKEIINYNNRLRK